MLESQVFRYMEITILEVTTSSKSFSSSDYFKNFLALKKIFVPSAIVSDCNRDRFFGLHTGKGLNFTYFHFDELSR